MDKYRRNDDTNDDLGVYNQDDNDFDSVSSRANKKTYVRGSADTDGEFSDRIAKALDSLTPQEIKLFNLMSEKDLSIREAAKLLGVSQQMASKYWKRIKDKLSDGSLPA